MHVHKFDVRDFIHKLTNIINNMDCPGYILINDVNHNIKARNYYEILIGELRRCNIDIHINKYYFDNPNRSYVYQYDVMHENNNITSIIPANILSKYNPWQYCSSAQLIIAKR